MGPGRAYGISQRLETIVTTSVIDPLHRQLAGVVAARRGEVRGAGRELVVGLVGRGIQASKTPRMHEFEGRRMGLGYTYVLFDFDTLGIGDEELGRVLATAEGLKRNLSFQAGGDPAAR